MMTPTPAQSAAITAAADRLGVPAAWLDAIIHLESGYDPLARNYMTGKARGLIQFMPDTAQRFFGVDADTLVTEHPDFIDQLNNCVVPYFQRYAPFPTQQSFYLSVFYPAYRRESLDKEFPVKVQLDNPGIVTVGDYVDFVNSRINPLLAQAIKKPGLSAGLLVLVAAIAYFYFTKRIA